MGLAVFVRREAWCWEGHVYARWRLRRAAAALRLMGVVVYWCCLCSCCIDVLALRVSMFLLCVLMACTCCFCELRMYVFGALPIGVSWQVSISPSIYVVCVFFCIVRSGWCWGGCVPWSCDRAVITRGSRVLICFESVCSFCAWARPAVPVSRSLCGVLLGCRVLCVLATLVCFILDVAWAFPCPQRYSI